MVESETVTPTVGEPVQTSRARPFLTTRDGPLTVDFIRSELQHHRWSGDIFEALEFMIKEYDKKVGDLSWANTGHTI